MEDLLVNTMSCDITHIKVKQCKILVKCAINSESLVFHNVKQDGKMRCFTK